MIKTEGIAALYSGASAKSVHSLSSSFLYFLAFTRLKTTYEEKFGKKIGVGATLVAASLAGCCNVLVTEPLDTYSTRKQLERKSDGNSPLPLTPSTQSSKIEEFDATLKALRGDSTMLAFVFAPIEGREAMTLWRSSFKMER